MSLTASLPSHDLRGYMLILFWACVAIVVYVYLGYPFVLWLGSCAIRTSIQGAPARPPVTIIVAAHDEESCIEEKICNLLALDYPREKVEILIGSDGSADGTEEIVRRFQGDGIGLVSFPQQHGKSAMQNTLASLATGELLVFTDADCLLAPSALSNLIDNFVDPRVGLVTACPKFRNSSATAVTSNEGLYLRYETWLRRHESDLGLLAMASGSLFAMRRTLWRPLASHFGDDFVLPLRVLCKGFVNRLDSRLVAATDLSHTDAGAMFRLKFRIIAKDFRALLAHRGLLNPLRYPRAAFALWSHKLLRWLVPYFLLAILVTNASLLARPYFRVFFALQIAFYSLALTGARVASRQSRWFSPIPMSFCLVNAAALVGTFRALISRPSGAWKPQRNTATPPDLRSPAPSRAIK